MRNRLIYSRAKEACLKNEFRMDRKHMNISRISINEIIIKIDISFLEILYC